MCFELARRRPRSRSPFSLLARVINRSGFGSYYGKSQFLETRKELLDEQCRKKSPAAPRGERGADKSDFDADGGSAVLYRGRAFTQMVRLRFRELVDGQSENLMIEQHGPSEHSTWAVVLATGEGSRLASFTRDNDGGDGIESSRVRGGATSRGCRRRSTSALVARH